MCRLCLACSYRTKHPLALLLEVYSSATKNCYVVWCYLSSVLWNSLFNKAAEVWTIWAWLILMRGNCCEFENGTEYPSTCWLKCTLASWNVVSTSFKTWIPRPDALFNTIKFVGQGIIVDYGLEMKDKDQNLSVKEFCPTLRGVKEISQEHALSYFRSWWRGSNNKSLKKLRSCHLQSKLFDKVKSSNPDLNWSSKIRIWVSRNSTQLCGALTKIHTNIHKDLLRVD